MYLLNLVCVMHVSHPAGFVCVENAPKHTVCKMTNMFVRMAIAASLATVASGQAAHGWRDQCDKPLIVPGDVSGWETGVCTPDIDNAHGHGACATALIDGACRGDYGDRTSSAEEIAAIGGGNMQGHCSLIITRADGSRVYDGDGYTAGEILTVAISGVIEGGGRETAFEAMSGTFLSGSGSTFCGDTRISNPHRELKYAPEGATVIAACAPA